jgi:hypothetical protein
VGVAFCRVHVGNVESSRCRQWRRHSLHVRGRPFPRRLWKSNVLSDSRLNHTPARLPFFATWDLASWLSHDAKNISEGA